MKASDIMTAHDLWATSDSSDIIEVSRMMAEHNVGAIPVLDEMGRLEGIVTDRDICCRIVAQGKSYETPVRDIMSRSVQTVRPGYGSERSGKPDARAEDPPRTGRG